MKYVLVVLCYTLLSAVPAVYGQESSHTKETYTFAPSEHILVTVVSQPGCTLQIEDAKYLIPTAEGNGIGMPSYHVRNRGTKAIRSFTVGSPAGTWSWSEKFNNKVLMPGGTLPENETNDIQIVPLSEKLRSELKLQGPMKSLIVLMVVRVEYADGSVYDAEKSFNAMRALFDRIDEKAATAMLQNER